MKKIIILLFSILVISCSKYDKNYQYVKINTDKGKIVVKLYNSTPKHRDNFTKLIKDKFYDGIIFHRVIKNFVIQGGDPDTKNAQKDSLYGEKDAGYLIDPEFIDTIFHKRGAIAMAREGDDVNPEKKSSSSQFYIVVGKKFTNEELDALENKIDKKILSDIQSKIFNDLLSQFNNIEDQTILSKINQIVNHKMDSVEQTRTKFKFSDNQRKLYTTVGGLPHLDGNYTVFGEVIEGMDVVDKISMVKTDKNDRPLENVKMKIRIIK